jgi:uncharacterized membrane protein YdjX (TVP38/TMEM64 family)
LTRPDDLDAGPPASAAERSTSAGRRSSARRRIVGVALAALAVVAAAAAVAVWGREAVGLLPRLAEGLDRSGAWAPIVFVLLYAASTVSFVPGAILSLAAGAIFGVVSGTLIVVAGATLGSCTSFLLARYLARGWVQRRLIGGPRISALDRAVSGDALRILFLLRLSPVVPYNVLNYAFGLTRVRFTDFLLACLGMIPGVVAYTYSGRLIGDVAMLAAGAEVERGAGQWAILALGFAATVSVMVLVTRVAQRALAEVAG